MRILVAHNSYQQAGGEDQCVADEVAMLETHGHEVTQYRLSNDAVDSMGRLALGARTVWSGSAAGDLQRLIRKHRPEVVHFHNTLPLISPSGYYAARAEGVPVVQTLHNFRIACVNALLFREGEICEDCLVGPVPWRGVIRRCYRSSRSASAAIAAMVAVHRTMGTWHRAVDAYIALTDFSRRKFVAAGLPADRIAIKANFVCRDPGPGSGDGGYAIFVGRLSGEKGLSTLLEAWRRLRGAIPLKIVGDGPLAPAVEAAALRGEVEWLGAVPQDDVYRLIGEAAFLVLPSECYENFPRVVIEAFAKSTPVIASCLGAMGEVVEDGENGLHFVPGDPEDLAEKVRSLLRDSSALERMRRSARFTFERKFTAQANLETLMATYARARARRIRAPANLQPAEKPL